MQALKITTLLTIYNILINLNVQHILQTSLSHHPPHRRL